MPEAFLARETIYSYFTEVSKRTGEVGMAGAEQQAATAAHAGQ
jgi:hypothetical protein